MSVLITIIVPIYNVGEYIEKCARSLFEQTYQNIEYIFVNDCTTDNSLEILTAVIAEYPLRKPFIHLLHHTENKGLPSARNTGLMVASGDYVLHFDSDDWAALDMIERMVLPAVKRNADIVFCDIYNVWGDQLSVYPQIKRDTYVEYLVDLFWGRSQGSVCNKLVKRALFEAHAIRFPEGLSMLEDLRTVVQLFYYAVRIVHIPQPLYFYVTSRTNSISGANFKKSRQVSSDRIANVKGIQAFLKSKKVPVLSRDLAMLKLEAKRNLLINADGIDTLVQWRGIFPEANKYIAVSLLPWHYKLIVHCVLKRSWLIPQCWIWMKKMKAQLGQAIIRSVKRLCS
ncbi:glycosyltransferase family 2 protein [Olivibacter sp. CPCC 100613]|uniref:glycosyltransferase family 2 protein n=1 Tax=Olivibacter sp. CPCC 100613 TaxID=3079931 RepID=UPI002FF9EBF8